MANPPTSNSRQVFDQYAGSYEQAMRKALSVVHQEAGMFAELKAQILLELAEQYLGDLRRRSVLDVGCGIGLSEPYLIGRFGQVAGVDVSPESVHEAARRNPDVRYADYDGNRLPYEDGSFDVTFAMGVLHHVPPPLRLNVVREMSRVAAAGGLVMIFDHNPLNPVTRRLVAKCDFDIDVTLIRRGAVARLMTAADLQLVAQRYITFFPWRGNGWRAIERYIGWLPLGGQHVVVGRKG